MKRFGRSKMILRVSLIPVFLMALASCLTPKFNNAPPEVRGDWGMAVDADEKMLGPADKNAAYHGFVAKIRAGEKIVLRGQFPHCRYISYVIYDQDFLVADALIDSDIVPLSGVNPFVPGNNRSAKVIGEYEIKVLMEPPPKGPRAPNTLYAGLAQSGKPNKVAIVAYRVYLADKGYGYRDKNPQAINGGVPPLSVTLFNKKGVAYKQSRFSIKLAMGRVAKSIYKANKAKVKNPQLWFGEPQSPPVWSNNSSRVDRRSQTVIPNDDTAYIMVPISGKLGQLLVLRWKAARTQEQSFTGLPFVKDADMRYWSLTFSYIDPSVKRMQIQTEKTSADIDVPTLPDGTKQIVIGFGGIERPKSVPPEQWVGLKLTDGSIIMRNIVVRPGYAGDFGALPAGPIRGEHDKFTPGGVYCSVEEFSKNPDIGLKRKL